MTGTDTIIVAIALDIDGVLTDGRVSYTSDGRQQKSISFRDIDAVFYARECGFQIALVTGEDTPWVQFIGQRLKVEYVFRGAIDKLAAIRSLAQRLQIPLDSICYIGDSDRDAPALASVGLGIAPANATIKAKSRANLVLRSCGGYGAVDEALKYVLDRNNSLKYQQDESEPQPIDTPHQNALIQQVKHIVEENVCICQTMVEQLAPAVIKAAETITTAFKTGHKLIIFGNGGSAADAQHFAAEFIGRFEKERNPLSAIALTTNTSILTALTNDYSNDIIFSRQIKALGQHGDVAIAISTSGNSQNVLEGIQVARLLNLQTIGMTGRTGGLLGKLVDQCLCVPSENTARVQEAHGLIIHVLCSLIENSGVIPSQVQSNRS